MNWQLLSETLEAIGVNTLDLQLQSTIRAWHIVDVRLRDLGFEPARLRSLPIGEACERLLDWAYVNGRIAGKRRAELLVAWLVPMPKWGES